MAAARRREALAASAGDGEASGAATEDVAGGEDDEDDDGGRDRGDRGGWDNGWQRPQPTAWDNLGYWLPTKFHMVAAVAAAAAIFFALNNVFYQIFHLAAAVLAAMRAGAELSESALRAGSDVIAFTSASTSAAAGLGRDFWTGVDLHDLKCTALRGRAFSSSSDRLADWTERFLKRSGCADVDFEPQFMAALSTSLPALSEERSDFSSLRFAHAFAAARVGSNGQLAATAECRSCSFRPVWANPLWEAWAFSLQSANQVILEEAAKAMAETIPVDPSPDWTWLPPPTWLDWAWDLAARVGRAGGLWWRPLQITSEQRDE